MIKYLNYHHHHKLLPILVLLILVNPTTSNFALSMNVETQQYLITELQIANKQVKLNIDLLSPILAVCCRPNRSIFQIIFNFLSNPFFQINQFACPNKPQFSDNSQVVLSQAGIIKMTYDLIEAPNCTEGTLGLSKNSIFISNLPINYKQFVFRINKKQNVHKQKITLAFGQIQSKPNSYQIFQSNSSIRWEIKGQNIMLNTVQLDQNPTIILVSKPYQLKIPSQVYRRVIEYFPITWNCQHNKHTKKMKCLCNNGISKSFPSFIFNLRNSGGQKITVNIDPSRYMFIDSNICTVLFEQQTQFKNKWSISITLFEEKIIYFDLGNHRVVIEQISAAAAFSINEGVLATTDITPKNKNNVWHLPLQLILNIGVILLLCVFVALLVIQMIKRVSGLAEVDQEGVRGYMLGAAGRID